MVVEAQQMKHAMNDDAVQLAFEAPSKSHRILLDAVDADAKLARNHGLTVGQRESYNVGVEVMPKSFLVDFQQFLVAAKIVVQLPYRLAMPLGHRDNPRLDL